MDNVEKDFEHEIIGEKFSSEDSGPAHEDVQEDEKARKDVGLEQKKKHKRPSALLQEFLSKIQLLQEAEERIRFCLDFMRSSLSHTTAPRFMEFWEARRLCLPLFKENIPPAKRAQLWNEYMELSAEARRHKEIADEQSAFASEQIDLAITALERDLDGYAEHLQSAQPLDFLEDSVSLRKKSQLYNAYQRELHLLNTYASRINSLRKEIVNTEMRARQKSSFFEKLSVCGDRVFPRRKELIKLVSQEFMTDVDDFVKASFSDAQKKVPQIYEIREEIKALQGIAKLLTLNTHAFTATRMQLSQCWDQIKQWEKDRKKEFAQKRAIFKQNFDAVFEKIKKLAEAAVQEGMTEQECHLRSDEILNMMKSLELGREEVRALKDELNKAVRPVLDKVKHLEIEREKREKELDLQRRERFNTIKEAIQYVLSHSAQFSFHDLKVKQEEFHQQLQTLSQSRAEKQVLDRLFKQMKDLLQEKKEDEVLNLSKDDQEVLKELRALLQERKERRQEIKAHLEDYRKVVGGSGFDFEKAMLYRELMEEEKQRLDKVNCAIEEIEEKIAEIEER